jgi:hypothetical protein
MTRQRSWPARLARVEVLPVEQWQDQVDRGVREPPAVVVLDVEPYVAHWSTGQEALDEGVARLAGQWPGHRVMVVTNSVRVITEGVLPATWQQRSVARKPFTRMQVPQGSVVVGDLPLQDGLLAWRLRATFVEVPVPADAPWWARFMLRVFRPVSRLYLRRG